MAVAADTSSNLSLEPDLERARELARDHNVIPVAFRFVEDRETPVSAFLKLRGSGPAFLLESAEQGRLGRYSFLGFRPRAVLRWSDRRIEAASGEGRRGVLSEWSGEELAAENVDWERPSRSVDAPDPYEALSGYLAGHRVAPIDGLPPFAGGAVGFFGYDLVRTVEPLGEPNPDPLGLPDMALMITESLLAFDHLRHELTVLVHAFVEDGEEVEPAYGRAVAAIEEVRARLREPVPQAPSGHNGGEPVAFESNMTRERFEDTVRRIIEYIRAGDAFQVVPSQRFSAPSPTEAFSIYRGLRTINPSPYMYFLEFGDFQLAGASPEPLLKVSGRRVETRPIAGTYPRGANEEEDRRRAEELLRDPKERAEHVMLVDLGRNDLGRVCEYGSVTVDELMAVETYSHVLHIVSQVSGTLRDDVTPMDALRAVLPAGTLSGAPKVRAMQIIDELEPHKRGSYGGAIGYVSFTGDLDTAIHIRTVVVKDGTVHVQAGGGTVADAKPDYEFQESVTKAKAIFRAVELASEHPEWP
jgi:anthranilate synthase component 1